MNITISVEITSLYKNDIMNNILTMVLTAGLLLCTGIPATAQDKVIGKPRILVSTDIGGTDPDDNQSMIHLLMYSDKFNVEGLVSTASYGPGSKEEILRMIDLYEKDFTRLSAAYPQLLSPGYLRSVTKQGRRDEAPLCGYAKPTEGSEWIIRCARKESSQPLWILVWGCLEDVAQALHDAPDIAPKIRINWVGGPNKKWGSNGYNYIVTHFPDLWFIEDNSSYRGFIGNAKDKTTYQAPFWQSFMKGHGAMATAFKHYYDGICKMGDTPTLLYLMGKGFNADEPDPPHWGGQFSKISRSPKYIVSGPLCKGDTVPVYSLMEWRLKGPVLEKDKDLKLRQMKDSVCFIMRTANQDWRGYYEGRGVYVVRYSPKAPATLSYTITSDIKGFPVQSGAFQVGEKWPAVGEYRCTSKTIKAVPIKLGNTWWSDLSDESKQGGMSDDSSQAGGDYSRQNGKWQGAATVSVWRNEVMKDWAERFAKIPAIEE